MGMRVLLVSSRLCRRGGVWFVFGDELGWFVFGDELGRR